MNKDGTIRTFKLMQDPTKEFTWASGFAMQGLTDVEESLILNQKHVRTNVYPNFYYQAIMMLKKRRNMDYLPDFTLRNFQSANIPSDDILFLQGASKENKDTDITSESAWRNRGMIRVFECVAKPEIASIWHHIARAIVKIRSEKDFVENYLNKTTPIIYQSAKKYHYLHGTGLFDLAYKDLGISTDSKEYMIKKKNEVLKNVSCEDIHKMSGETKEDLLKHPWNKVRNCLPVRK